MSSILLFGANGQLGRALVRHLKHHGFPAFPGCSNPSRRLLLHTPTRAQCDLRDEASITALIHDCRPQVILNAAAFTAVDRAETEKQQAHAINGSAVAAMAAAAARTDSWLVHFSTDYVFDGKLHRAYHEEDMPRPLSVYGQSKLEGEQAILTSHCHHLIFRTSWLYSNGPGNFLSTILQRLQQNPSSPLNIIADTRGTPSSASRVASASLAALAQCLHAEPAHAPGGLYHLSAGGCTSWYDYAQFATQYAETLGLVPCNSSARLHPIAASEWPAPAPRPQNSQLNNLRFQQQFGLTIPDWHEDVRLTLELLARQPRGLTPPHEN